MSRVGVRRAFVEDAVGIARVHIQAWREAYAGHVSAEFLANLAVADRADRWQTIIAGGATDVFVAFSGGGESA